MIIIIIIIINIIIIIVIIIIIIIKFIIIIFINTLLIIIIIIIIIIIFIMIIINIIITINIMIIIINFMIINIIAMIKLMRIESIHFFKGDELIDKFWIRLSYIPLGFYNCKGWLISMIILLDEISNNNTNTPTYSSHAMNQYICELSLLMNEVHAFLKILFHILFLIILTLYYLVKTYFISIIQSCPFCHC